MNDPTFGSLFAGIGGIDLGLERAGWTCRWQVENDTYCLRVLEKHWPKVRRYGNIKRVEPAELEPVTLVAGGFPCQPTSYAGKRLGNKDPRWLWPEMARIIRHLRPRFVLVENPPGLYTKGFGRVLGDLAEGGYTCEWDCLPAAAFGAPHLRYRLWLVAYTEESGLEGAQAAGSSRADGCVAQCRPSNAADSDSDRLARPRVSVQPRRPRETNIDTDGVCENVPNTRESRCLPNFRHIFPGQPDFARSSWWLTEPSVGRVAPRVPFGMDRLEALGNAVVPQCAEWIGRRILTMMEAA